jgi:large-conductance mechanosensitive channel
MMDMPRMNAAISLLQAQRTVITLSMMRFSRKRGRDMFLSTLMTTLFKMVILAAIAFFGIKAGKKLRDSKDAKAEKEA